MQQVQQPARTILIADDDPCIIDIMSRRCRALGLRVLTADDAFSALSLAKAEQPDVLCLDVSMPGGNGLGACEMLLTEDSRPVMPVVILTGRNDPETIRRCHQMAAYYVEKSPDVWSRMEPLLR